MQDLEGAAAAYVTVLTWHDGVGLVEVPQRFPPPVVDLVLVVPPPRSGDAHRVRERHRLAGLSGQ